MGRALVGWVAGKFMSNERRYQVMDGVMGVADGVGDRKSCGRKTVGIGSRRKARYPMAMTIRSGFPLRRCSWSYDPIVSPALVRRLIRWLDFVCVTQTPYRATSSAVRRDRREGQGVSNGM